MSKRNTKIDAPLPPVHDTRLYDALGSRYLSYALSTIMARSLPDVRDGMKPVHRRLLYAMRELKLAPNLPPKKSARVVGDVMGKYHPHGDSSIYDALVRLAQDFNQRYPLIEGQGNFGNIDGDSAAAMRYTEARLTEVARLLLDGIDEDSVDFRDTYDGAGHEPVVLPAAFPNLLANGASGIAVGMATFIPPHNVAELCDAMRLLIKTPAAGIERLVSFVQGPDFPTGGVLIEPRAAIIEAYKTGRGAFRLRALWEKEELKGGGWQIVVTQIPYLVQKSRLIEKIAELLTNRKLPLLDDVRDESASDIRLVLVPKTRNVDPDLLMEQLFRLTDLESRISLNMNALDKDGVPQVMDLRQALQAYLDHRQNVLVRRSTFRLKKIEERLDILAGYLAAYLNLDKVIKIIRTQDEPKPVLMKSFSLNDTQAEAILNMRLRALRKLEEMEIKGEQKELASLRQDLKKLLGDEGLRWQYIDEELGFLKKTFGKNTALGARRTLLKEAPLLADVSFEAPVTRENITIVLSDKGWVRALRGHDLDNATIRYKEGDEEMFVFEAETTDKILLFGSNGRFYTLSGDKLPSGRSFGEPVRLMVDLPQDSEIIAMTRYDADVRYIIASTDGRGFVVEAKDVLAQTRAGKQILNVSGKEKACTFALLEGDSIAVIGTNRKLLVFPSEQLPVMARGKGVILQRYKDGKLSDIKSFNFANGLSWQSGERTRTEKDLRAWQGDRAGAGRVVPTGFSRSNRFDG
ncbi:MAG: DNA topoisomerase IV subunit A [Alphaproteobacteria bacterium]|nr:DNA topoisomerase IV subunit A [Alphaproteobacteria bacterium]